MAHSADDGDGDDDDVRNHDEMGWNAAAQHTKCYHDTVTQHAD